MPFNHRFTINDVSPRVGRAATTQSLQNAVSVKDQFGITKTGGVYASADGVAVEVNGVTGKGKTDNGGDTDVGFDWGIGVGSSGAAAQASIVNTKPLWTNNNKGDTRCN
jgi:hypothetical protein